ncbi:MAG: DedA family protein [Clostridiales bacterium]|jgi:membrane protein DedA with SNARE-associated domain|nr:DedA family protein [Clostridiales bacterium]
MESVIADIIDKYGYLGVCALIAAENIFPPIPSEIILTFGGFMTTVSALNPWGIVAAATAGSMLGAAALYGVGRAFSEQRLERLLSGKIGGALGFKKGDVASARERFARRGVAAVFFCRFVPIARSLVSIPAGMARVDAPQFIALTLSGTFVWNAVLVFMGRFAGAAWETAVSRMNAYSSAALAVSLALAALAAIKIIKKSHLFHSKT